MVVDTLYFDADTLARRVLGEAVPVTDEVSAAMRIWRVPSVRRWAESIRAEFEGSIRPVSRLEEMPYLSRLVEFRRSWRFWLGEEHPGVSIPWRRYEVDAWTGDVRVWDPRTDTWQAVPVRLRQAG